MRNVIEISEEEEEQQKWAIFMCILCAFYKVIEHYQCSTKHISNRLIKPDENNHNYIVEDSVLDYYRRHANHLRISVLNNLHMQKLILRSQFGKRFTSLTNGFV